MFRVLKPGGTFTICNSGGGAPAWPLTQAPFESAEGAFEWESVRTSAYRTALSALNPASVAVFKRDYLRKAQDKRDQYGIPGLTTAALFGVGYKPVRD